MNQAAIYAAVSPGDRRGVTVPGLEGQVAGLRGLAAEKGFRISESRIFRDVVGPGRDGNRPQWERLIQRAAGGKIHTLFVHAPDRLGRAYLGQVARTDAFLRHGQALYFLDLQEAPMDIRCTRRSGIYLDNAQRCFILSALCRAEAVRTILDVGGGTGRFAIPLWRAGYRVVVAEATWLPLLRLRARSSLVHALRLGGETRSWPVKDETFDGVLAIEVPRIVHRQWFWTECCRILKPGGIVIASVSNRHSYKGLMANALASLRVPNRWVPDRQEGRRWYLDSTRAVKKRIRDAALQVHRTEGLGWLPMGQASNSRLIPLLASLERACRLNQLSNVSPWTLVEAKKPCQANSGSLPSVQGMRLPTEPSLFSRSSRFQETMGEASVSP